MGNQLATQTIGSLYKFLCQHIAVNNDLRIEGCDGTLSLTATWFKQHDIEASPGLTWIKTHGPDCNCDCEIYSNLQDQIAMTEAGAEETKGG